MFEEPAMPLHTPLTKMLRMRHPVLLAPMDLVADAGLAMAVTDAGGYAFLGGGYGDPAWLERELALLQPWAQAGERRFGIGFITWSLARKPQLLDLALQARPDAIWLSYGDVSPFAQRIKAAGVKLLCQVQTEVATASAAARWRWCPPWSTWRGRGCRWWRRAASPTGAA
jgi:nitronate monooxygenase